MKLITINIPEQHLEELDKLVQRKLFPNRAEAIRFAIRDMIMLSNPLRDKIKTIWLQWNSREKTDRETLIQIGLTLGILNRSDFNKKSLVK